MGQLLYTVKEIFTTYLKTNQYKYKIPPYQRGYKWEPSDVTSLLDDISSFVPNEDVNSFYCLQNITLIENKEELVYHVVDGQQRLTTLMIILSYIEEIDMVRGKVLYAVRENTQSFIDGFLFSGKIKDYNDWDSFLSENQKYDYQDIYYVFQAYKAVEQWFKGHDSLSDLMKGKILDNVQVIVNLPRNVDEQELFENLNGKRVSLDGADLVRALIITRVAKIEIGELDDEIKRNVLMNERRIRIGLSLDSINLWWSDENRQIYFRNFTQNAKIADNSNVDFNEKYPINNLYRLYVLAYGDGELSINYFEKSIKKGFLEKLLNLQRTIENWYNDNVLYHLILFTYIYASQKYDEDSIFSFKFLVETWEKHSRQTFINYLKERIKKSNNIKELVDEYDKLENEIEEGGSISQNEKSAFGEDYYNDKLTEVSVLLDIISNLSSPSIEKRLPAIYFKRKKEDWEHIFPQTPIGNKIKDKNKQTEILLQYVGTINNIVTEEDKINIIESEIKWDDITWKEETKNKINDKLRKIMPINSLGNMCLLHENVNRGYGNDFFSEKRIDVMIKSQQGYFVRPHVYDAFNKIFLKREQETIGIEKMSLWSKDDILERRKYIIKSITEFLKI